METREYASSEARIAFTDKRDAGDPYVAYVDWSQTREESTGEVDFGFSPIMLSYSDPALSNHYDLPPAGTEEEIIDLLPEDHLRDLALDLLKSALRAYWMNDISHLAMELSGWIATAEEYALGPENIQELLRARKEMK